MAVSADSLPLAGVRVVQIASLFPGPLCCQELAKRGADVVMIERPPTGDPLRQELFGAELGRVAFDALNRGKRSVVCDVRDAAQLESLHTHWFRHADVAVISARPDAIVAHGFDGGALLARHPHLVVCTITGYGMTGPLKDRAGHDLNYLARAGVLGMADPASLRPMPVQYADIAGGGLAAAFAITAALVPRMATPRSARRGTVVDIAMVDGSAAAMMITEPIRKALKGTLDVTRGRFPICGGAPCYDVYPTQDGRHIVIGALEAVYWRRVVQLLGLPESYCDPTVQLGLDDAKREETRAAIAAATRRRTFAEWCTLLETVDNAMMDPVLLPQEAAASAHFRARHGGRLPSGVALEGGVQNAAANAAPQRLPSSALGDTPLTSTVWQPTPSKL